MDWIYVILAFALSTVFINLSLNLEYNDVNLYLLSTIMSLIFHNYKSTFRLCGFLLIILFIYFIRKPI